ncbi:MAG: hypothetical protein J0L50_09710 [Sphingomonadales bacterium]|nr:hypothetical protein [Sphingomonadales bacterium]
MPHHHSPTHAAVRAPRGGADFLSGFARIGEGAFLRQTPKPLHRWTAAP